MESPLASILSRLGTIKLPSLPTDATCTDTYFSSYEEVQKWVNEWIASKYTAFYRRGICSVAGEEKVVENGRNYFD